MSTGSILDINMVILSWLYNVAVPQLTFPLNNCKVSRDLRCCMSNRISGLTLVNTRVFKRHIWYCQIGDKFAGVFYEYGWIALEGFVGRAIHYFEPVHCWPVLARHLTHQGNVGAYNGLP